jgi:hypothetical protein
LTAGGLALPWLETATGAAGGAATRGPMARQPLKVQSGLTYHLPQRREATSWRA